MHNGVKTNTGWGDGEYPVFALIKNGCVFRIIIDFDQFDEITFGAYENARWEDDDE